MSVRNRNNPEVYLWFWPRGPRKPFVFVHVEGTESESHTGRKGKARVGLESKYNKQEAGKIVSVPSIYNRAVTDSKSIPIPARLCMIIDVSNEALWP